MENTKKISVLQGICASLILVAYFLPWIRVSFMNFEGSTSYFNALVQMIQLLENAHEYSSEMFRTEFSGIKGLLYLFLLVPFLTFINVVYQWVEKAPRIAFYLNLIPFGLTVALMANAAEYHIDISELAGIGFYITFVAGLVSFIAAWTTIGMHYYRYRMYMKVLTYCVLLSIALFSISIAILNIDAFDFYVKSNLSHLVLLISIIPGLISAIHFPFLIYAWIVVLLTQNGQKQELAAWAVKADAVEMMQRETSAQAKECLCPQCQKPMEPNWKVCPYCASNLREEEQKKQENENLRFAPPGCRGED